MTKKLMPVVMVGALAACSKPNVPDVKQQFIEGDQPRPLVVVLGGSEGGNTLAEPHWQPFLDGFNHIGTQVAALAYYGSRGTPASAAELSLNSIAERIKTLTEDPRVNPQCVAVVGFSKGAELALLLGAHFETINHVVAIMPTHVSWNAVKTVTSRASWVLDGQALDYVNAPLLSWQMQKGNFTGEFTPAFTRALAVASADDIAEARIAVEKTNGPVMLVSAKQDEVWPSYQMAQNIEQHLQQSGFTQPFQHLALEAGHYSFNKAVQVQVHDFLQTTLLNTCHLDDKQK